MVHIALVVYLREGKYQPIIDENSFAFGSNSQSERGLPRLIRSEGATLTSLAELRHSARTPRSALSAAERRSSHGQALDGPQGKQAALQQQERVLASRRLRVDEHSMRRRREIEEERSG